MSSLRCGLWFIKTENHRVIRYNLPMHKDSNSGSTSLDAFGVNDGKTNPFSSAINDFGFLFGIDGSGSSGLKSSGQRLQQAASTPGNLCSWLWTRDHASIARCTCFETLFRTSLVNVDFRTLLWELRKLWDIVRHRTRCNI